MKLEKYIIIKNCTKEELKTILNDWLIVYANRLKSKMVFEIAEINPNVFVLEIGQSIDDTFFFFLVNYFAYPIGFKKTFEAEGYTTATKHKTLRNKKIYVFNNAKDTEYDNVWITTEENETYKFDFGGKLRKVDFDKNYKIFDISNLSITHEQIIVNKKELLDEAKRRKDEKSRHNLEKRFKIISTAFFVIIPLAFLTNKYFSYLEDMKLILFCAVTIMIWFMMDYKIFKNFKRTFICMLLASLILAWGINTQDIFLATTATMPLSSIIFMWTANILLGEKLDYLYDKLDRLFVLVFFAFAVLISIFVFNPILKLLNIW
ncbi:MAG: hypothetical protein FWH18_04955 [Marinilabiliaceae bacterium]|nr:hypothetical protein [Marinilabiliaceae bacterium]